MKLPIETSLFASITQTDAQKLLNRLPSHIETYHKDEVIFRGEEIIHELGIVLKGKVLIGKETRSGNMTLIALLDPGSFIGEVMALTDNPISNLVTAYTEGTQILFLPVDAIMKEPALHRNLTLLVARKALYLNKRVYYLQLKSIQGKISKFILEESGKEGTDTFTTPFNRQTMAEYLNVSRPSLSRELGVLKKNRIIDYYKGSIKVLNRKALEDLQE